MTGYKILVKGFCKIGGTELYILKDCFAPWLPPEGSAGIVLSTAPGVTELPNLKWFCHKKKKKKKKSLRKR